MPDKETERRDELVAAAIDGTLTPDEVARLAALRLADPSVDAEIAELRRVLARVAAAPRWDDTPPPPSLRDRVLALEGGAERMPPPPAASRRARRRRPARSRRPWVLGLAAAACIAIGAGGALAIEAASTAPRTGPPGTPGAVETVQFTEEATGVRVDGALVAHSWGTETILEIDGLAPADSYVVVLVESDGERVTSGTFFGSEVTVDCRMNAAVDRDDVVAVEIEDAAGALVAQATVPAVA